MLLLVAALLALLALLAACSSGQAGHRTQVTATVPPTLPAGWLLYRDPGGYFTIALPPGWQSVGGTAAGHGVQEGPTGAAKTTEVGTAFFPPDGGPNDFAPQLRVDVHYTVYTDISGTYTKPLLCGIYTKSDTTIGRVRAQTNRPLAWHSWEIATSAVLYQVSYGLPSDRPHAVLVPPPTAVPQATATADQQLARAILATFKAIPSTPPTC